MLTTKWFKRWSKRANLNNHDLLEAIENLQNGLSTAQLGNHLFKIRDKLNEFVEQKVLFDIEA